MLLKEQLSEALQKGNTPEVKRLSEEAINGGIEASLILDGLLEGMGVVGRRFKANEIFVPEVLIAARALNAGLEVIRPALTASGVKPVGKALIGTVEGDLHDIGKNLVKMMMVGVGIEVIDLGVDIKAQQFVDAAIEHDVRIICMSALLTTTMNNMKKVIDELEQRDVRKRFIVMVGGAPLNAAFAEQIGADYYSADAQTAAEIAQSLLKND
jgi:5-methyltetrahydrofolate--homocysteine methyltransferase